MNLFYKITQVIVCFVVGVVLIFLAGKFDENWWVIILFALGLIAEMIAFIISFDIGVFIGKGERDE